MGCYLDGESDIEDSRLGKDPDLLEIIKYNRFYFKTKILKQLSENLMENSIWMTQKNVSPWKTI